MSGDHGFEAAKIVLEALGMPGAIDEEAQKIDWDRVIDARKSMTRAENWASQWAEAADKGWTPGFNPPHHIQLKSLAGPIRRAAKMLVGDDKALCEHGNDAIYCRTCSDEAEARDREQASITRDMG